jgi:hypothetical protein
VVPRTFWIPDHPPSQEAMASRPWRNAVVLRSLGEGGLELRRVTPYRRCHGLLPVGLHVRNDGNIGFAKVSYFKEYDFDLFMRGLPDVFCEDLTHKRLYPGYFLKAIAKKRGFTKTRSEVFLGFRLGIRNSLHLIRDSLLFYGHKGKPNLLIDCQ